MASRALLVGINKYRIPGSDLRGCVNDVRNIAAALERRGFRKADIATLVDERATKKAMQDGIRQLIRGGRKGDVLLVHYSGHGSNVPDKDGDEADTRDEILCPTDLDWKSPLADDWLRSTFDGLRAGVNLTVIMDCCHSGTNTRAVTPPDAPIKERFLPNPRDLMAVESGRRLRGKVKRSRKRPASRSDIVNVDLPEVLITGCRDTQTSADALIDDAFAGALTYALVAALSDGDEDVTYRDLHGRASATLKRKGFDQVPQLEGRKSRFDEPVFAPLA